MGHRLSGFHRPTDQQRISNHGLLKYPGVRIQKAGGGRVGPRLHDALGFNHGLGQLNQLGPGRLPDDAVEVGVQGVTILG